MRIDPFPLPKLCLIVALICSVPLAGGEISTKSSFERGIEILERAFAAHGGTDTFDASQQIILEMEGSLDRGARHQGLRTDSSHPTPYREWLVIDGNEERVGFQQYHERFDGAIEWWRFVYTGEDRMRFTSPVDGFAVDVRENAAASKRRRLSRLVPVILIHDALANASTVRYLGSGSDDRGDFALVSFAFEGGETVTLAIDEETHLLRGVQALVDETLLGDTLVEWRLNRYRLVEGLGPFPIGYETWFGGRRVKDVTFTRVSTEGIDEHPVFTIPEGIEPPPPPAEVEGPTPLPQPPRVLERAPWVWQVAGIRSGFNVAFFELEDSVVVFEAPAGWIEIHEIPPSNFVSGVTSSSTSQELIGIVHETIPGKPIQYVVLSHFHGDHAGGVGAFIAEGATVVTTEDAAGVVKRAASSPHRIGRDRLGATPAGPSFLLVDDRRMITDGERRIEILELIGNPHAEGLLAVWLPDEKLLFVADVFHATRLERYPLPSELALQVWFGRWLDETGIEPERIFGVHGGVGTPEHLEKLRAIRTG